MDTISVYVTDAEKDGNQKLNCQFTKVEHICSFVQSILCFME